MGSLRGTFLGCRSRLESVGPGWDLPQAHVCKGTIRHVTGTSITSYGPSGKAPDTGRSLV